MLNHNVPYRYPYVSFMLEASSYVVIGIEPLSFTPVSM